MVNRLRIYLFLIIGLAGFSALVGLSYSVVVPYTAADALEETIRGVETPDEIRSRIADYYVSTATNRLLLLVTPGLAAGIVAALALFELVKQRDHAASSPPPSASSAVRRPRDPVDSSIEWGKS